MWAVLMGLRVFSSNGEKARGMRLANLAEIVLKNAHTSCMFSVLLYFTKSTLISQSFLLFSSWPQSTSGQLSLFSGMPGPFLTRFQRNLRWESDTVDCMLSRSLYPGQFSLTYSFANQLALETNVLFLSELMGYVRMKTVMKCYH